MEDLIDPRRHAAPLLLLLLLCLLSSAAAAVSAKTHVIGGNNRWAPNINYTEWAAGEHFYQYDWLVFFYEKGLYNVIQVNETNYESCSEENPILKHVRGRSYAMQLNYTGRYYFISGGGYCWHGMKLSILVNSPAAPVPVPSPSPSPSSNSSAGGRNGIRSAAAAAAAVSAAVLGLLALGLGA